MLGIGCDFSLLFCGAHRLNFCAWPTALLKLFTDNNVNWPRIASHCQVAPAQGGQTETID